MLDFMFMCLWLLENPVMKPDFIVVKVVVKHYMYKGGSRIC